MIGTQTDRAGNATETEEIVFVDLDDDRVQEEVGEPLFNERGLPSDHLQRAMALLKSMKEGLDSTQAFVDKLLALDLVVPAEIHLELADRSKRQINGLYTVNRDRLQGLPGEVIAELYKCGYLEAIHILLASFGQVHSLVARKNARIRAGHPL